MSSSCSSRDHRQGVFDVMTRFMLVNLTLTRSVFSRGRCRPRPQPPCELCPRGSTSGSGRPPCCRDRSRSEPSAKAKPVGPRSVPLLNEPRHRDGIIDVPGVDLPRRRLGDDGAGRVERHEMALHVSSLQFAATARSASAFALFSAVMALSLIHI